MERYADRDNYFILLELPFEAPDPDPDTVRAALRGKKQEWTRWQNNPGKRGMALKYLDLAPEIERVMLDPALRARQAEEARELQADMLRRMEAELRVLEAKGYLTPREITAVTVKYKTYGITKVLVESCVRCPVSDKPPGKKKAKDDDLAGEVLDRITAKAIKRSLAVLRQESLYTFLDMAPYSAITKLRKAAEEKRRAAQQNAGKSAEVTATQELAGICMKVFADFNAKQRYDRYLKVSRYPALGDLADEEFARSSYISPTVLLRLVNFAVESYGVSVLEAEEYIRRYCTVYDIPIDTKGRTIVCPGCDRQVARQAPVCQNCGAPLRGECPACGSSFSEGSPVCSECGFALGKMVKALRHIDDAQNAIIESNWVTARRNIQYVRKYWPGHPQIEPLEKRVASLEDRYAWYVENIEDCMFHSQYYAAQELVKEATSRKLRIPAETVESIQHVIGDFEARLSALKAGGSKRPPASTDLIELGQLVGDSMELSRMMKQHPPKAPAMLRASISGERILLNWHSSPSAGVIEYVLVRKKGGAPLTAFDGDVLYQGKGVSFEDSTLSTLCEYYYGVFAGRNGAFSSIGAIAGPLLIIPELDGLRILPTDQGAILSWRFHSQLKSVQIWRKLGGERPSAPGEGFRLETTRIDGFTDSKLKNDVEYWYFVVATYDVDGQEAISRGVCENVMPHKFVAPVDGLLVVPAEGENAYIATWSTVQPTDVLLFATPDLPEVNVSEIVPIAQLLTDYELLEPERQSENTAHFHYDLNGGVYIFTAAVFGKFAAISHHFYLTHIPDVSQVTWDLGADELYINLKWPAGIHEVLVAYRLDRFPESADEMGTTCFSVTREQYEYNAAAVLKEPEQAVYYVKIYAVFHTPGGWPAYSDGVEVTIENMPQLEVFYHIQRGRRLLARSGSISITLSSPLPFLLPRSAFVGKVGRVPLCKTDGVSLFEIEEEIQVDGEIAFEYEIDSLPDDLYIRMFLHNDSGYDRYRLLPHGELKIT